MATKTEKPAIRTIGLKHIKVDHAIQSRVETSVDYMREFSEAILRGDQFPPIDVFFDGKTYWLADGFHRFGAHDKAGRKEIRCTVHDGDRRGAMVFSAGANKKFSIPRTTEDIKKAIFMLMEDQDWFTRTDTAIAGHVGVGIKTASKYRAIFYAERAVDPPSMVLNCHGRYVPLTCNNKNSSRLYKGNHGGKSEFRATIQGKPIWLGRDREVAEKKLAEAIDTGTINTKRVSVAKNIQSHQNFLLARGVVSETVSNVVDKSISKGLGDALVAGDSIVVWTNFDTPMDLVFRVGQLLMLRQLINGFSRVVVLCVKDSGPQTLVGLASALGVEFLTPEQFVASIKKSKRPSAHKFDTFSITSEDVACQRAIAQ